ncbi:hypothetical protein EDB83DRAFT_2528720 [Lactarius deliciosus]|nr:hypothetical protein EDB83DRAFT_2528720 [Lactarius deliciosus]
MDPAVFTPSLGGKATHPTEWSTMTDSTLLQAVPEIVQPISRQLPSDSRRLCQWESATSKLLSKEYGEAMCAKQKDIQSGVPTPTQAGREALEAKIKYEHEDENEDDVERDNGGVPAS